MATWQADVIEGTPDGRPPLVVLRGLALDRTIWEPALAELCLADPGRQVLALDLPDHAGSSPWSGPGVDSVVAAVHDAARWARLEAPVVVGHAGAAVIATMYAACYPARGVVTVDQWLPAAPSGAAETAPADEIRWDGFLAERQRFHDSKHRNARRPLRPASRMVPAAGSRREALVWPSGSLAVAVQAALVKIRAAGTGYLFIAGHEVEPGYRRWLSQVLPQARIEVFAGSDRFPQLDCPRRFAACLTSTGQWGGPAYPARCHVVPRDERALVPAAALTGSRNSGKTGTS